MVGERVRIDNVGFNVGEVMGSADGVLDGWKDFVLKTSFETGVA